MRIGVTKVHEIGPFFSILRVESIKSVWAFLKMDPEAAHRAPGPLRTRGMKIAVSVGFDLPVLRRNDALDLIIAEFSPMLMVILIHLQSKTEDVRAVEDRKWRTSLCPLRPIIAPVDHK